MVYLVFIVLGLVLFYAFNKNRRANKRKLFIEQLINNWGQPTDNYRDIDLIASYHQYLKTENSIPDSVANDIDLDNIYNYADRTCSKPGQQCLYHQLRSPQEDISRLQALDKLAEQLSADEDKRTAIQMELFRLGNKNAYYLYQLFAKKHPPLYGFILSLYIRLAWAIWISAVILTIIIHTSALFLLALGLTLFNFYLHYNNKSNILKYIHSLPQLYILTQVSKNIYNKITTTENAEIEGRLKNIKRLNKSLRYVTLESGVANDPTDIAYAIWELIKIMLVIEPAMFISSINKVTRYRDDIEALFNYVGKIDMAISIQSFRLGLPYYSKPVFINNYNALNVTGLYHPLVENCVPNSLHTFDNQGVLVTGSNMSGKTTFIRALAANTLLSQTLYTSCTKQYEAPLLQLFTSIRISDDMEEHKSYFQAEAISVLNIMNQSKARPVKSLVIIDEIFRGTNTIERVAAAKAILSYFTANKSFVFVSTHDLELAELLGNEYAIYCFEEQVADTRLVFDYKIKPGILKNKNAIAIMAGLGYPEAVIADAYAMSETLREKYKI
ncbi:MutS-like protein [Mucilaginibacter gracilis]|uniref:MutS-like protein n=1 Tax=Mucilaginibacter gracilis TaxID=423350 RepID=A0A495IWR4_9SPHI|nr:hypothetical protein [Mucilaginibacter gracilis]RKR81125.1 MutS-like protein [Mucilaginibacter gracilis]